MSRTACQNEYRLAESARVRFHVVGSGAAYAGAITPRALQYRSDHSSRNEQDKPPIQFRAVGMIQAA